jgi:hypothetical protein
MLSSEKAIYGSKGIGRSTNRVSGEDEITYWIANVGLLAVALKLMVVRRGTTFVPIRDDRAYIGTPDGKEEFVRDRLIHSASGLGTVPVDTTKEWRDEIR